MEKGQKYINLAVMICSILSATLLFSKIHAEDCNNVLKNRTKVKNIIVLIPGAASSNNKIYITPMVNKILYFLNWDHYFKVIQHSLIRVGFETLLCPQQEHFDKASLIERSQICSTELINYIKERNSKRKETQKFKYFKYKDKYKETLSFTLIGHSMGGLVGRMVAINPKLQGKIKNVITISTPNKGTVLADYSIEKIQEGGVFAAILNFFDLTNNKRHYINELAVKNASSNAIFNTKKMKGIQYYSIITGLKKYSIDTRFSGKIIEEQLLKRTLGNQKYGLLNDGVVPSYSQILGKEIAFLNISHFESACVDLYKNSKGCLKIQKVLAKFLIENLKLNQTKSHKNKDCNLIK